MKTAVIYARYSSDNQTEQSIEGQIHSCEKYAKENDILIVDTYIDRAMTGTNDNRPDFQRMLKDSNKKKWDYVLVYKFDRFSRNKYETTIHKHTLANNGVKVISAMENIPDTPEGIILESLLEGMNQYYSAELAQKVKRGMNETRLKGNFTGGYILYGYSVVNKKVVINEEQAKVVRFIYKQFALGMFVKDIIKELTERHIYNNGKPFARNTIYNILKNEKYSGIYKFENVVYENIYPRIVEPEIYDIVRAKTNQNKYGKRSIQVVYLFRNKLKCGYCGSTISAETGTSHNGIVKRYYKCLGRKHGNNCQKCNERKDDFENFLFDTIIKQLDKPENLNNIVNHLLKVQDSQHIYNSKLNTLLKEQKEVESSLNNIMLAIEKGIMNNTTNKRMKELETKQEELDKLIILEKNKKISKLSKSDIQDFYKKALQLMPDLLINYLIKKITVYDDKIEITYNTPLKISPDSSQGFLFDKIIRNYKDKDIEFYMYI